MHNTYKKERERSYEEASLFEVIANDKRSLITFALCNISAVLQGLSLRMVLIWRFRGCSSQQEWQEKYPSDAELLFRACVARAGAMERRLRAALYRFNIWAAGDIAVTAEERHARAATFVESTRD